MQRAQICFLPDGRRMHLHHGPIDMIVDVKGPGRDAALKRAALRFETLLDDLVGDLPRLRAPDGPEARSDPAHRMVHAVAPFAPEFVTPMAAVAGAGADTILAAICAGPGINKAYVNNGGDIAFFLSGAQSVTAAVASTPPASVTIQAKDPTRGIASSGWKGRSHSLGIADNVTVLARTAAMADAAATMVANAVDVPGHPGVKREPASAHVPDSDLGDRHVTVAVGNLPAQEIDKALNAGVAYAHTLLSQHLIHGAYLCLQGEMRLVGHLPLIKQKVQEHA